MKIKELHLVNFMNISEADFVFDDNMNFIYGQPASGKSALFDAMRITLSTYKRSSTYGEYVKQGEDNALITLKADIFGKMAVFTTTLNRVKGNACKRLLEYDGESFEDSQVEEWLKSRNIDYHAKLAFAMQNEVNIVEIGSAERLTYIQKLFKFDFKAKKDKLMASKKEVEDKINELNSQIAGNRSTIEHLSIEQKTEDRTLDDETKKKYEAQIAAQMEMIKANQSIIDKANAIKDEINKIDSQIVTYDSKISQEEQIIANELEKERDIENLKKEIGDIDNNIKTLSSVVGEQQEKLNNKQVEKNEIDNKINEHITRRIELETKIQEVNKKILLVEQGICPNCEQPTKNLDNNLKEQLDELSYKYTDEQDVYNDLCIQKKRIEEDYSVCNKIFNENNAALAGEKSGLKLKQDRLNLLLNKEPAKHVCNIDEVKNQKNELIKSKEDKAVELNKYKVTKTVSELLDEIEPLKKAINDDNITIEKNAIIIKTNSENKAKCAELKIANEKLLDEVVTLNNKVSSIKEAYEMVNKTLPKYISKRICDSLQSKINKFIHRVFPKYEVKLEVSDKGCDLLYTKDKTIVDEKRNKYLKADMSSGLERYILSLAFKVSLAESYKLDLFVGDEIDQSANDQDAKILTDMLINSKSFKQLFIISHKNEILDHIKENYKCNVYKAEDGKFNKTNYL